MVDQQQQYYQTGLPDMQNAFKLADTTDVCETISNYLNGMEYIRQGDSYKLVRVDKPKFTYEFTRELVSKVFIEINRISGRTHFDEEDIRAILTVECEELGDYLNEVGMDKLVSNKVWDYCSQLAIKDKSKIFKNKDGVEFYKNFWWTKYEIEWNEDYPFTSDMLNRIKEDYNLKYELFDQAVILSNLYQSILVFVHGGLNRSLKHLTLDHEKVIVKESRTFSGLPSEHADEGRSLQQKNTLRRMFGK